MNRIGKTVIAAGAGVACCAPLVWPFVSAALIGSGGSLAIGQYFNMNVEMLLGLVLGTSGLAYFAYRTWKRKSELESGASCEIGGACDPKEAQR